MESEYDRKFEEMKKYIPFLENMIKRLESTSSSSQNPRQAQLDKIRSLRDLLLDKKKRMKMENLLKCEQVLINLYAKVEQKDTTSSPKSVLTAQTTKPKESNDLETVRNKLKSVVSKSIDESQETLPEIARANVIAESCTPGSKEPALFQRRPNKASLSPVHNFPKSPNKSINVPLNKRNYTRVLLSPEPGSRRWENNEKISDQPLFSRRSPRRSPKRYSPSYNKRERKKPKQGKRGKDLNITLNVPEESIDSLNSKDILSRIMNCNDNDVDIETLREAKRQILNELKHTGAKCDDISDLLLKSYKKSVSSKRKDDVEEGELSDSESEAISSIYDNFILDDGNDTSSKGKSCQTQEKPRKIQICLVINSDKEDVLSETKNDTFILSQDTAADDFEMYDKKSASGIKENLQDFEQGTETTNEQENVNKSVNEAETKIAKVSISESSEDSVSKRHNTTDENKCDKALEISDANQPANFYKPINDVKRACNTPADLNCLEVSDTNDKNALPLERDTPVLSSVANSLVLSSVTDNLSEVTAYLKNTENEGKDSVEIPLLHDQSVATQKPKEDIVSEIDILQALKNEILGEPMSIPGSETTPLMHQPKLSKVASVQEIAPKKRISIEKYKKKTIPPITTTNPLFINDPILSLNDDSSLLSKEDNLKKQSLKLTEKECERFNFPTKLALDDDDDELSDEDLERDYSLNDIYENLAPKSPDNNDAPSIKNIPPVIIPVDPVKTVLVPSKSDVDMRTLTPNITTASSTSLEMKQNVLKNNIEKTNTTLDPRMRKDLSQPEDIDHPALSRPVPQIVSYSNIVINASTHINPSITPKRPLLMTPNMAPSMTPNRGPSMTPTRVPNIIPSMAPNMTPSRNPNMTPNARTFEVGNRQQFEIDDNPARKHVYAPMFPIYDQREGRERERSVANEQERRPHFDQADKERETRIRDSRWGDSSEPRDGNLKLDRRSSSVHREVPPDYSKAWYGDSHNNYDNYKSRFNDRRDSYSRSDCPRTPLPSFDRSEAPMTPIPSFGRSDCPPTPSHPFGRSDCPLTPSHPFGRSDCPQTPNHPFGRPDFTRNDGSMTPSHSFGRVDMPSTPNHPFGRSEPQSRDPRLNRSSDYDSFQKDDLDRNQFRDHHRYNSYRPESNKLEPYRNYREHSVGRNDRSNYSEHDSRHYNREQPFRRDSSVGRASSRDFDNSRDRRHSQLGNEQYHKTENDDSKRIFIRERSAGSSMPSRRFDSRASSVSRKIDDNENRLSVKSDVGNSFIINTSVQSTFQDFLRENKIQELHYSFNDRRRRASSVGRTLCRESSVGRLLPNTQIPKSNTIENHQGRNNFKRARSVGRDILTSEKERSFKDIKEEFEKFRTGQNIKLKQLDKSKSLKDSSRNDKYYNSKDYKNNSFTKKDVFEKTNMEFSNKKPYSPKKNYRDPRVRRELQWVKSKYKDGNSRERERKNVGMVYSHDNITKGTILGSGYGVKNYKIPKIKRLVEAQKQTGEIEIKKKEDKDFGDRAKEKSICENKIKNKPSKVENSEAKCNSGKESKASKTNIEIHERRVTRLNKKSEISSPSSIDITVNKAKKSKKPVIYDSDSDADSQQPEKENSNEVKTVSETVTATSSAINKLENVPQKENLRILSQNQKSELTKSPNQNTNSSPTSNNEGISNIQESIQIESSFGIDDLEIFSDNLASDPVLDNINALIAGLDNDLESSKTTATALGYENVVKNIPGSNRPDENNENTSEKLNDTSDINKKDLNRPASESYENNVNLKNDNSANINVPNDQKFNKPSESTECTATVSLVSDLVEESLRNPLQPNQGTNDNTVSTTEINKENLSEIKGDKKDSTVEGRSVPDSTNEVMAKKNDVEDGLPDSTNETQNDVNSFVTSSHDTKDNLEPISSIGFNKETASMTSIGNILSILQNKSKLKEILSLLGDQSSDNEKIKKKLEKLSEIVSDEDDETENNQNHSLPITISEDPSPKFDEKAKIVMDEHPKTVSTNESTQLPEESKLNSIDCKEQSDENIMSTAISADNTTEKKIDKNAIESEIEIKNPKKQLVKKRKITKKGRGRPLKTKVPKGVKRITRSTVSQVKKPSRELMKLQEDLKEMFISDDVLNATGIRMCRLAKLVDDNIPKSKEDITNHEPGPVVLLEKYKDLDTSEENPSLTKNMRKKAGPKTKLKSEESIEMADKSIIKKSFKYKPGPKSKTRPIPKLDDDDDPYAFESDSVSENNDSVKSVDNREVHSSDSENDSIDSSQSFGSTELLVEPKKKPKRKRPGWQSGVIKPKNRKKKIELKQPNIPINNDTLVPQKSVNIPDSNCFIDKSYCFHKNVFTYSCRICVYTGDDIVNHYKQQHPHSEIPLSRLSPEMAKEAIEQCTVTDFQAISNIPSDEYICRFCFKTFGVKKAWRKCVLEEFFWHIVSVHTGEYKHSCSLCVDVAKCPFKLDIPPPPKDVKGQLIGYICEKCNFTQISLENLKTHVIVRHNDVQTEVYTINLAVLSRKAISALTRRNIADPDIPRVLRSRRSNESVAESSDDHSDVTDSDQSSDALSIKSKLSKESVTPTVGKIRNTNMQSKITFENDDIESDSSVSKTLETIVKKEVVDDEIAHNKEIEAFKHNLISEICGTDNVEKSVSSTDEVVSDAIISPTSVPADINDCAHFKVSYTESGSKEYICCVNGMDNHYKTTLLISLKKHVQFKHIENWDGYCSICKVIVTPQGRHKFKDCLQHYLDKHMDSFPVLERTAIPVVEKQNTAPPESLPASKPYINVRPISELMSKEVEVPSLELPPLPKIENVMSLGSQTVGLSQPNPGYPPVSAEPPKDDKKEYKYEEIQAEVMSKKHRVVLDTMMNPTKLINVFKCAGRYCSFTSDSAEEALVHASTHKRVGGENSLICSYCDFDCSGNAIDLVMHVFKAHGSCPYTCGYCFYRAAASQLVKAHIGRIHGDVPLKVLSVVNVPPPQKDPSMLSRNDAVQYYICSHACKFRAYTAGKYCEHLVQQHAAELCHACYICKETSLTPQQLIQHMKDHDLNVYQCTWCVHGADSETSLLLHASQKHPDKQPQAYARVIQRVDIDGSSQLRVLPLVSFNKSKVSVQDITAVTSNVNSAKEAEREAKRSIELEKLIGHTTQFIESMESTPEIVPQPPTETESAVTSIIEESETLADTEQTSSAAAVLDPGSVIPTQLPVTPPRHHETSEQVTPKIKTEPIETPTKILPNDVVCLDTDDETSRDSRDSVVIALSDDETATSDTQNLSTKEKTFKLIPNNKLFKCPTCNQLYKMIGRFRTHVNTCIPAYESLVCPHCFLQITNREALIRHYIEDHTQMCSNVCSVCSARFIKLSEVKAHLKSIHGATKFIVSRVLTANKEFQCVVSPAAAATAPKRKNSSNSSLEPPPKLKRFGPQDVDLLPINPILDESVSCSLCEFKTKVRLNMVRHLQLHAEQQPVPQTAPINPVPHLETNEKHFDKMVNLASSSIVTRAPEKPSRTETSTTVSLLIPPEAASRYPKYVPDRQRHTCGAKGCSYISVDEAMLRCHWETLHSGTNDFHCVHCPPYQHLDTSKPLTAARIIAHLKMHDTTLYACSSCTYYHYKKQVLEKHLSEIHKGSGRLMVVREEVSVPSPGPSQPSAPTPTMDLKAWQCGLCSFKSMLRPEVVEHCTKSHQSKMQFKCFYCPFRTSALENVTKHQSNSHPNKSPEVFYYYYREGSLPDELDGIPRWMKQRQKFGSNDPEVKSEVSEPSGSTTAPQTITQMMSAPIERLASPVLDLNIVKKEVEDTTAEMTVEQLVNKFGQVCEPNGLKYKCPLCKVVIEDTRQAMQSHLYEELKYRKWVCPICAYKAFHKTGLNEHIVSEHRVQNQEPTQLPQDVNIEKWVGHILDYQTNAIDKNRENFSKQKIIIERPPVASTSTEKIKPVQDKSLDKFSMKELEDAFGPLGVPNNMMFCCPKCNFKVKEEAAMRDHLEMELTKIRWCCSNCAVTFHRYHEAQFHCKSAHVGCPARPMEAVRDPAARAAWLRAALRVQRLTMNCLPLPAAPVASTPTPSSSSSALESPDDSLLVVRYEETVTPTEPLVNRKRPAEPLTAEDPKRKPSGGKCPHCPFKTKYDHVIRDHIYRHYNLKPFACVFCEFNGFRPTLVEHLNTHHYLEYKPEYMKLTTLPTGPPICDLTPKSSKNKKVVDDDGPKVVCLICEQILPETAIETHTHDKVKAEFGKKGDVVVKCCICLVLRLDQASLLEHHNAAHPDVPVNYAFFKLLHDTRESLSCGHCNKRFKFIKDFKTHHSATHGTAPLKYSTVPYCTTTTIMDSDEDIEAKRSEPRKVARKSTTKLPAQAVAKKSTTKLPYDLSDVEGDDEYSFYGTKPPPSHKYENVTTLMSFCNTMVPFTMKKLSEVIKINPCVLVRDIEKKRSTPQ